jgi:hypothetical protein
VVGAILAVKYSLEKRLKILKNMYICITDYEILNGISVWETNEIEQFMLKINKIVANRKENTINNNENDLLKIIKNSIPEKEQKRFEFLSKKLQKKSISTSEHAEMLELVDLLEQKHAERLEKLIELAHLRNVPLDILMQQLQLTIVPHASK